MNNPIIRRTHAEELRTALDENAELKKIIQERSYLHPMNMANNIRNIQALLPKHVTLLIGQETLDVQHSSLGMNTTCAVDEIQTTLFAMRIKADEAKPEVATNTGSVASEVPPSTPIAEGDAPFSTGPKSVLESQIGGEHYKKLGDYQPWMVLKHWLTDEEFRGFMKGTAIVYLARERDKGGDQDIEKATHTLQGLNELGLQA